MFPFPKPVQLFLLLLLVNLLLPFTTSIQCYPPPPANPPPGSLPPSPTSCAILIAHLPSASPPSVLWPPNLVSPSLPFLPHGAFHNNNCILIIKSVPNKFPPRSELPLPHYPGYPLETAPEIFQIYAWAKSAARQILTQCMEQGRMGGVINYALYGMPLTVYMITPPVREEGYMRLMERRRDLMAGREDTAWPNMWKSGDWEV